MTRRDALLLLGLGLAVTLAAAYFVRAPGYMDAEYYYSGGLRLRDGYGLSEPFLWNYLDAPAGLPHPSHLYWMPLASLLSAAGLWVHPGFFGARLPFLVLSSLLPAATGWFTYRLAGSRRPALLAGFFAALSGFYLPYLVTTDTFGLYMLLGAGFLLLAAPGSRARWRERPLLRYAGLGLLAGLAHLARADGLLWLGAAGLVWLVEQIRARRDGTYNLRIAIDGVMAMAAGYLLVTGFWYARNLTQFGALFAPGNSRALWLTDYDDMFTFDPARLNLSAYRSAGWGALLRLRWQALGQNLQTWLAVQGQVVLLPLALIGAWTARRDARVRLGVLLWALTLMVMTLVFPLAGARGGFFHSGAAVQVLWWACAALGFEVVLRWGVARRGWQEERAWKMFAPALVGVLLLYTAGLFANRVVGTQPGQLAWQQGWDDYRQAEAALIALSAQPGQSVAVNNPPGYFSATGRAAIVIPNGDVEVLVRAARRFGVSYVILEPNHVRGLERLYTHPVSSADLVYLKSVGKLHLFRVTYPT